MVISAVHLPPLGLSTAGLAHFDAFDLVLMATELGVRHIETSPAYDNESAVGGALSASEIERDDLVVSSVTGCHGGDRERLFESFDVTLDLLGLRRLDLLLLRPDGSHAQWIAACSAVSGLVEEGTVGRIGITVDRPLDLDDLARAAPFDVLATDSSPGRSQRVLRRWCAANGWDVVATSPFGPADAADPPLENPVLLDLARDKGVTVGQVVLAWATARPASSVVFACSSPDELFELWESRRVELTPDEVTAIDALDEA